MHSSSLSDLKKTTEVVESLSTTSARRSVAEITNLLQENLSCRTLTQESYTLSTDASQYAYSGFLTKAIDGSDDLRPIVYTSGSFTDMQQKWSATEKEAFAFYQSVLKFDLALRGAQCILCHDHKLLEPF